MRHAPPFPGAHAARHAIAFTFLVNGAVLGTWVSRIPAIKQALTLSDAHLGLALLSMAVGALAAFPVAGALIARVGSRRVTAISGTTYCLTLPLLAAASDFTQLACALFAFGAMNGAMDVAMNAHGADVEQRYRRPIMSSLHGMFSLGGLLGAAGGAAMAGATVAPGPHFLLFGLIAGVGCALVTSRLLRTRPAPRSNAPVFALPHRALLSFGVIAFCAHLTEGAMADWSAVYLRQVLAADSALAAIGFAAFSLTMTAARLAGDRFVTRIGPVRVLRLGGLTAATGLSCALLLGHPLVTLIGFACVGLGMATISPLVFSAAARTSSVPAGTAIAAVATMGYSGFLAGPPLIGLLAESVTLRGALLLVVLLSLAITLLAPRVASATPARATNATASPEPQA